MAGVHGLQQVERLGSADFADDDALGPHTQAVAHQFAHRDLAFALDVGRPGFQPHHMRLLQLKLGGVFAGDDALVVLRTASGSSGAWFCPSRYRPDISTLQRTRPMICRISAPSGEIAPNLTNWSRVSLSFLNLRMVSAGPSIASGGTMALTREPSARRASQIGEDS